MQQPQQPQQPNSSTQKYIATVRFNNKTWKENQFFKEKLPDMACIYSVSHINTSIPQNAILYVIEMNNDTNQIMGIGIVRNHPKYNQYQIYENPIYNTFAYTGRFRIDRSQFTHPEEMEILEKLETLCFKGKGHLKRLKGIKVLSKKNMEGKLPPDTDLYNVFSKIIHRSC